MKFALEMGNGVQVRDLTKLKENFSLNKIIPYVLDGRLATWLRDRHEEQLAQDVSALDKNDPMFPQKLCELFGAEYKLEQNEDDKTIQNRMVKLSMLTTITTDSRFLDAVDQVAFTQDDIYDLLDAGETVIYLCGTVKNQQFVLPLNKSGITYIGIDMPEVYISSEKPVDWENRGIKLENVRYDAKYQKVLDLSQESKSDIKHESAKEDNLSKETENSPKVSYKEYANQEYLMEEDLQEVYLNEPIIISKGEVKQFHNQCIHIKAKITCIGMLDISNCVVIYYNNSEILVKRSADIKITDSYIEGKDFHAWRNEGFIRDEGSDQEISLYFENCTFKNSTGFIYLDNAEKVIMKHCRLQDCGKSKSFMNVKVNSEGSTSELNISENLIIGRQENEHYDDEFMFITRLYVSGHSKVNFHDNVIYGCKKIISGCSINVYNCEFYHASYCLQGVGQTKNCKFVGCEHVFGAGCSNPPKPSIHSVKDCVFIYCKLIADLGVNEGLYFQKNQCIECFGRLINTYDKSKGSIQIVDCEFYNITNCVLYPHGKEDIAGTISILLPQADNIIQNCIFDGIFITEKEKDVPGYLIAHEDVYDKQPNEVWTKIANCTFRNCRTNRSGLVRQYVKFVKILGKSKHYNVCTIKNCSGLDRVDEDDRYAGEFSQWNVGTDGNKIGVIASVPHSKRWEKAENEG